MSKYSGPVYLCLAFVLAGTSVVAARAVSGRLGAFGIAAASLLIALVCLLPLCYRQLGPALRNMTLRALLPLILQAFFGIFLFRVFLLAGLKLTSAAEAGLLTGATPAFTAILACLLLRERPNRIKLIGVLGTVIGVLLVQGVLAGGLSAAHLSGNLLVLCTALCEAVFNILSRFAVLKASKDGAPVLSPVLRTFLVVAIAFVLCLAPVLLDGTMDELQSLGIREWLALLWYGGVVTALAFIFWYRGISRGGALTAAACAGMMPLMAMVLSVTLLGEVAGWQQWSGAALVTAGMITIGIGDTANPVPNNIERGERYASVK